MSGKFSGVQALIRAKYSKSLNIHCAAHSFNLVVCTSIDKLLIRNCFGLVERLHVFFNILKRKNELLNEIEHIDFIPNSNVRILKRQCATRWVQKYESLSDFFELLPFVVKTLETICSTWSTSSSKDENVLLKNILNTEFLISLYVKSLLSMHRAIYIGTDEVINELSLQSGSLNFKKT